MGSWMTMSMPPNSPTMLSSPLVFVVIENLIGTPTKLPIVWVNG